MIAVHDAEDEIEGVDCRYEIKYFIRFYDDVAECDYHEWDCENIRQIADVGKAFPSWI